MNYAMLLARGRRSVVAIPFPFAWSQIGADIDDESSGDLSRLNVSVNGDGSVVVIGEHFNSAGGLGDLSGHVRVYEFDGFSWVQKGADIDAEAAGDQSGHSVSISSDGTVIAIGAPYNDGNGTSSGHVRVYEWSGSSWVQAGADIDGSAGDRFGWSVSLSSDGSSFVAGAPYSGANGTQSGKARVYERVGSSWSQKGGDIDGESLGDQFGFSASISNDGSAVAIGAIYNDGNGTSSGRVRVSQWSGSSWSQKGGNIDGEAAENFSGHSVSLSGDGSAVAIGAPYNNDNGTHSGQVRVYEWSGSSWVQRGGDIDGESAFDLSGLSVSLSDDASVVAIGALGDDGNGMSSGHVRVYEWSGSSWVQRGGDIDGPSAGDQLGWKVSLSGDGTVAAISALDSITDGTSSGYVRVYKWRQI